MSDQESRTERNLTAADLLRLAATAEAAMREPKPFLHEEWQGEAPAIDRLREERDAKPPRPQVDRERAFNAEFWARDDVRGARNSLDVWASCKHARASRVGVGVPTLEVIFEFPRAEDWESAGRIADLEWSAFRTSLDHPEAYPRLIELAVDGALLAKRAAGIAVDLLMHLYPRTGTYQRAAYSRDLERPLEEPEAAILRAYRPDEVVAITAGIRTAAMERKLDSTLQQLHRELVLAVGHSMRLPAEVFAAEILGIRVPSKPMGRPKKSDTENETKRTRRSIARRIAKDDEAAMERANVD
jgi:hypothetical protein